MAISQHQAQPQGHRIFVIDDHPLVREGLSKVIELQPDMVVVGELGGAEGAIEVVTEVAPDAILLDLSLRDGDGLKLIENLRMAGVEAPILVLSMHEEKLYAQRSLEAGANGYMMKSEPGGKVIDGLKTVLGGEIYLSDAASDAVSANAEAHLHSHGIGRLTIVELEVLALIGRGLADGEIARILGSSEGDVEVHRRNLREKLHLDDDPALLEFSVRLVKDGARVADHFDEPPGQSPPRTDLPGSG